MKSWFKVFDAPAEPARVVWEQTGTYMQCMKAVLSWSETARGYGYTNASIYERIEELDARLRADGMHLSRGVKF